MADKRLHHFQKEGITTPREERVQMTHQQNAVGFLWRTVTSTKPVTCVPSLQAVVWSLFPATTTWMCLHMRRDLFTHACTKHF